MTKNFSIPSLGLAVLFAVAASSELINHRYSSGVGYCAFALIFGILSVIRNNTPLISRHSFGEK